MNPCVKTGCVFQILESGDKYCGDLFHDGMEWQVRGFQLATTALEPDAVFSDVRLFARNDGSPYADTNPGIVLEAVSDTFRDFIAKWYPYLVAKMP